jgi:hypothetical protein
VHCIIVGSICLGPVLEHPEEGCFGNVDALRVASIVNALIWEVRP